MVKAEKPYIIVQGFELPAPTKMNLTEAKQYAKKHFSFNKKQGWNKGWEGWTAKDLDRFENAFTYLSENGLIKSTNISEFVYSTWRKKWTRREQG